MRNTWLVIKREYLERVRQRSFIVLTLLLPAIMIGAFVIPAKLSSMKSSKMKRLVVVTSTPQFGEIVRQQLLAGSKPDEEKGGADKDKDKDAEDDDRPGRDYAIEVDANASEAERTALRNRVNSGDIDGYLWLSDDAVAARKVTYYGREASGFMEKSWLSEQLDRAILLQELAQRGVSGAQVDQLLKPVKLETMRVEGGKETKANDKGMFFAIFAMVMLLYTAVIFYGVSVMRAVLEEKNSRVMEVLLSSATFDRTYGGKADWRRRGGSDTDRDLDCDGRDLRVAGSGGERQHGRDPHSAADSGGFCLILLARIPALQQYLCRDWRCHHQRAGRATTPVHYRSSPYYFGFHDGAGHARSGRSGGGVDFDGPFLFAGVDVPSDCGSTAAGLANRSFAGAAGGHDCGNSHSLRTHLPDRHPDVRQASDPARNREVVKVREGLIEHVGPPR